MRKHIGIDGDKIIVGKDGGIRWWLEMMYNCTCKGVNKSAVHKI